MDKQDFINFLINMENKRKNLTHWSKIDTNSDDYWRLYKPGVDWLEDDMDLSNEGIVKITYNKTLGIGEDTSKVFETTYDDFVKNYDKTVRR